ncbi:hypothetical protein G647_03918 [Cladophialophora carrionii CBS 160.54]|uniref:Zinc finger CHCC-type domain-containing protein n=1 Tax=Cladophialophora carrionii CBS 160.54 TaxID=1279043 RepID=V9DCC3_9EURO|nr:uncharacterized protein G647_03918 [Cladophialophora carrionii CBS 160.54]ETI24549.1 hypothetical protein G647_03918 [Cladophialophora carrionii CBS 160.54]
MASLIPALRTRVNHTARLCTRQISTSTSRLRQGPGTGENFEQANDPTPRKETPNVSKTNELEVSVGGARDAPLQEFPDVAEKARVLQAPNRANVWSRNQMPREVAMSGPRFEQTIIEAQPRPYAAIELIHKQPVRWVDTKIVACDGGGGPLGHPRIFINTDRPQICWCTYCGLPYAHTKNKAHLESLPSTSYPLAPTGDPDEIPMPTSPSQKGEVQGQFPILKGEHEAESIGKESFEQR